MGSITPRAVYKFEGVSDFSDLILAGLVLALAPNEVLSN